MSTSVRIFGVAALSLLASFAAVPSAMAETTILNVSYDPTRELYKDFNAAFAKHYEEVAGETVTIQ